MATGAVYPVLSRFERDGWLSSHKQPSASGPARKYYALTQTGGMARLDAISRWQQIAAVAQQGLSSVENVDAHDSERNMS